MCTPGTPTSGSTTRFVSPDSFSELGTSGATPELPVLLLADRSPDWVSNTGCALFLLDFLLFLLLLWRAHETANKPTI